MSRVLPQGWARVPLADAVEPRAQRVAPEDFKGQTYIGLEHVEPHTNRLLGVGDASAMASSAVRLEAGDVLYGRMRPYLNKVLLARQAGVASAEFIVLPRAGVFEQQFLMWRLASRDFVDFACSQYEGDRPRVRWDQLARFEIDVPPFAEQGRIVEQLEALFSDLQAGTQELAAAQSKLTQYRQSLLKAAVEGDLTAEWRASNPPQETGAELLARMLRERRARWEARQLERFAKQGKPPPKDARSGYTEPTPPETSQLHELPREWTYATLGQCFDVGVGATPSRKVPEYWNGHVPWVSSGEVRFNRIRATRESITQLGLENCSTQMNPIGSVLLGMIGEGRTRGQVAILDIEAANNQNCAAIWVSRTEIPPEFIYYWLWSRYDETRRGSSGNNQPALNKTLVEAMPTPVLPVLEAREIVERVAVQLAAIERQEREVEQLLKMAAAQRQNILRAAFSGQLVPQDPTDEPASVLLDRIRAERAQPLSSRPAQSSRRLRKTTC